MGAVNALQNNVLLLYLWLTCRFLNGQNLVLTHQEMRAVVDGLWAVNNVLGRYGRHLLNKEKSSTFYSLALALKPFHIANIKQVF